MSGGDGDPEYCVKWNVFVPQIFNIDIHILLELSIGLREISQ